MRTPPKKRYHSVLSSEYRRKVKGKDGIDVEKMIYYSPLFSRYFMRSGVRPERTNKNGRLLAVWGIEKCSHTSQLRTADTIKMNYEATKSTKKSRKKVKCQHSPVYDIFLFFVLFVTSWRKFFKLKRYRECSPERKLRHCDTICHVFLS